jgi:hypothetical protein
LARFLYRINLLFVALIVATDSFAAASYNSATGRLSLSSVLVGGSYYDVTLLNQGNYVFSLASAKLQATPAEQAATYSAATGLLNVPDVIVGNDHYRVVLRNNGNYVFSLASAIKTTPAAPSVFYTPSAIVNALQLTRDVTWSALTSGPADLVRFTLGPSGSGDLVLLTESNDEVNPQLQLQAGLAKQSSATDDLLLRSMFQFIAESGGGYRIVSSKHSNYALDVANASGTGPVIPRDIRSGFKDAATAGYLVFEFSGSTLTASGRRIFNVALNEYVQVSNWQPRQVSITNNLLALSEGVGSALTLYAPPINLDIPFDFNPDGSTRVSNPEVTPQTKVAVGEPDPISSVRTQVTSAYANQVATAGIDSGTTAAASAMLTQIEADLLAEGAKMRYPAEFYLAFREGLMSRVLPSSDSTDGVVGQLTVPYVFFTNAADSNGLHQPFMVIASYGLPDSLALLWDVPRPPGDGLGSGYNEQAVTRSYHREAFLMKIPLRDYGEVSSLTENIMESDLASDVGVTSFDHHNYASVSATGVAIDGVVIYPSYNNSLHVSQEAAELSAHGMHSGRGLGVHYHADAHSATREGLNLYNDSDYAGHSHPPIISIGFDGVAGYGVYRDGDVASDGSTLALDAFGGHEHGIYGYHYHSFTQTKSTTAGKGPQDPPGNVSYTAHQLPPRGAWAGRINDIPEFWKGPVPDYVGGKSIYLGTK